MKLPFVRNPYNYDTNAAGDESGLDCSADKKSGPHGRTQQHFEEECNINTIIKRFGLGYDFPADGIKTPMNGDFTDVPDLHTAMQRVRQAQESFDALPAELRSNFDNNPAKLANFVAKEENRELAGKLGILNDEALERLKKAATAAKQAERDKIAAEVKADLEKQKSA